MSIPFLLPSQTGTLAYSKVFLTGILKSAGFVPGCASGFLTTEIKGIFIDLCSMYWSRLGELPYKLAIQKICNGNATALDSLCNEKIIEVIEGNIYIKFLSEQLEDFKDSSSTQDDADVVLSMLHYGMYRRCLIHAVDINGELGKHMLLLMVYWQLKKWLVQQYTML